MSLHINSTSNTFEQLWRLFDDISAGPRMGLIVSSYQQKRLHVDLNHGQIAAALHMQVLKARGKVRILYELNVLLRKLV